MRDVLLTDVGEYRAHAVLAALLNTGGERNIGDDCAVHALAGDDVMLVNVDRLASKVDPAERARLCVAQTLSDIICMGGVPESFLVALTLPRDTTLAALTGLTADLRAELARYEVPLIGGDTKEGAAFHMVGVALGRARADALVRRVGAAPGMAVGVTSTEGRPWGLRWANAVINALRLDVPAEVADLCRQADSVVRLPVRESRAIIGTGTVRAGVDLSDGLGGGLRAVGHASNVGFELDITALTGLVDPRLAPVAAAMGLPLACFAFGAGYDWENLYIVDGPGADAAAARAGGRFTVVGTVTAGPGVRMGDRDIDIDQLPSDEKFHRFSWDERFATWPVRCGEILQECRCTSTS